MLQVRKIAFRARGRSAQSLDIGGPRVDPGAGGDGRLFLQIRPAFADPRAAFAQRSNSTLSGFVLPICLQKLKQSLDSLILVFL